jgi:hypothetical protein
LDGSWGKGINLNGYNDGDLVKQELPGGVLLMYQSFVAATGFAASPRSFFFLMQCSAVRSGVRGAERCGAECAEPSGVQDRRSRTVRSTERSGGQCGAAQNSGAERPAGGSDGTLAA